MKPLFVYYILPALLTLLVYGLGISEGVITAFVWISLGINTGFILLFSLAFLAMSKANSPMSKVLWPITATDLTLWDLARNVCLTTAMTLLCLRMPVLFFLPLLFAIASISALFGFLDHGSREYSEIITATKEKHGEDAYKDDEI